MLVLQDWVTHLSLKQQTVLFTALRGPDTLPKDNPAKRLCKFVRFAVLLNADTGSDFIDEGHVPYADKYKVTVDHDEYPHHFLMHLVHTAEVIGYYHPMGNIRRFFYEFYHDMCDAFHMHPETKEEMDERLKDFKEPD